MRFCGKCGLALDGSTTTAEPHQGSGFDGADALAYAGEKTSLWSDDTMSGYSMSKRALNELEAEGRGDSDSADIARRGITIAKAKWIISAIIFVIILIIGLSVLARAHSNNGYGVGAAGHVVAVARLAPAALRLA
jgi:hypothetical protein